MYQAVIHEATQASLASLLEAQRGAHRAHPFPSRAERVDRLRRLGEMTERHQQALVEAIAADFGHRSGQETRLTDLLMVGAAIRHAMRHLGGWMKPRRAHTALHFLPGSNRLVRQPLGVVGVIAPWNYPYQLAIGPALAAIAAGNRVMIKPSEYTLRFSALLQEIVAAQFDAAELTVVTGGVEVAQGFSALPFDHLVFTGSTATGRHVALAAARNLTPVTLELGGKSPAIVDPSADIAALARSLAFGKGFSFTDAMASAGFRWDVERLSAFLGDPQAYVPGTSMAFRGVSAPQEREALVCFFKHH